MVKRILIWSRKKICELIDSTVENEFDFNIIITGKRGLGKSTLAWLLAQGCKFARFRPRWDLVYSRKDVIRALSKRKKSIIIGDEIIQTAFNRDFYTQTNKMLVKTLTMYRDSNNLFISCIPNFASLDNQFRSLIRMRIDVVKRGIATIHTPNKTQYTKDIWDSSLNERIEREWLRSGVQKPKYAKLTTFRGILRFPPLSKRQQELYNSLKAEKRNQIYEEEESEKEKEELKPVEKLMGMLLDGKIKNKEHFDDVCEILDLTPTTTQTQLRKLMRDNFIKQKIPDLYIDTIQKKQLSHRKMTLPRDLMPE